MAHTPLVLAKTFWGLPNPQQRYVDTMWTYEQATEQRPNDIQVLHAC